MKKPKIPAEAAVSSPPREWTPEQKIRKLNAERTQICSNDTTLCSNDGPRCKRAQCIAWWALLDTLTNDERSRVGNTGEFGLDHKGRLSKIHAQEE